MRGATAHGENLLSARLSRGLTQEQLAALADVDVKTIRKAEQGRRLDVGTLARLALALGIEVHRVIHQPNPETDAPLARRKTAERWVAVWDAQDIDALLALYHEQGVLFLPGAPEIPFGGEFRGKAEIRRAHETAWTNARTTSQEPSDQEIIVSGDTVIVHGTKGVHTPQGDVIRLSAAHLFTFAGDLILELRVEYDTVAFRRLLQLPSSDSATE